MNSNKLQELQKQQQSKNLTDSKPRGLLSFEQFIQYLKDTPMPSSLKLKK